MWFAVPPECRHGVAIHRHRPRSAAGRGRAWHALTAAQYQYGGTRKRARCGTEALVAGSADRFQVVATATFHWPYAATVATAAAAARKTAAAGSPSALGGSRAELAASHAHARRSR